LRKHGHVQRITGSWKLINFPSIDPTVTRQLKPRRT